MSNITPVEDSTQGDIAQDTALELLGQVPVVTPTEKTEEVKETPSEKVETDSKESTPELPQADKVPAEKAVERNDSKEETKEDVKPTISMEEFEKVKNNYDELRSFSDRTMDGLRKQITSLKEELTKRPDTTSEDFTKLNEEFVKVMEDNKKLATILQSVQKEWDIDLNEYEPKTPEKQLKSEDIAEIVKSAIEQQMGKRSEEPKKEEPSEVEATILDFMGRKGLLEKTGEVGEKGKAFLSELDKLNPAPKLNSDLFEKMIDANRAVTATKQDVIQNQVKQTIAEGLSGLGQTSNATAKTNSGTPFDDVINSLNFYK